jgi:hypothetical protein
MAIFITESRWRMLATVYWELIVVMQMTATAGQMEQKQALDLIHDCK